jgi:hypothetical protein
MARRRIPRIYDVELETMKARIMSIRFGKVRDLVRLMEQEDKDIEVMDAISEYLTDALVSWDLVDEDGEPIEVSREAVEDLEYGEVIELVNKWLDIITGPGDGLGKGSNSGETIPVELPTMEAL